MSSILDDFQVLEVPRTFSIAEVKIMKNKISFNVMTASELAYPGFIRLFISDDRTQLALQPCEKETPNAVKFYTQDRTSKKRRSIPVGNRALVKLVRDSMKLVSDGVIVVPGVRYSDEQVILFDLKQAYLQGQKTKAERRTCFVPKVAEVFHEIPKEFFGRMALPSPSSAPIYEVIDEPRSYV